MKLLKLIIGENLVLFYLDVVGFKLRKMNMGLLV